ncbi:MAG: hypothetical protein HC896_13560 [Bacteroidales bacterium]|nr:hypothetical protein [Bacteroidales bacterium]
MVMVLGKIDDADQLFINGKLVASTGNFYDNGNHVKAGDAYSQFRGYYLPQGALKAGNNIVAVRVFDSGGGGGIY